jgi:hypothetical protein
MRFSTIINIFISISILLAAGAGCSTSESSERSIEITYDASFNGQTALGNLNLMINMKIENHGYESFNITPSIFSVKVGEFLYNVRESQLQEIGLPDGENAVGSLLFHVPPDAKVPRTGYEILYTGPDHYNIRWIKSQSGLATFSEVPPSDPIVNITYSTDLLWLSPPGTWQVKVEPPGNLYLAAEMIIENKGYESFHTNPDNFTVTLSNGFETTMAAAEEELIDWREVDIPSGGKFIGTLVFHVPTVVAQSFFKWDYVMSYSGIRDYNIEWNEIIVTKCVIDGPETDLDTVYLYDGESITGKLAYVITQELTAPGFIYEMVYDEETDHNVQWFDSPEASSDMDRNPLGYPAVKITYSTSILQKEETGRIYLIVDVLIENKGYEFFFTSPANFFLEISNLGNEV